MKKRMTALLCLLLAVLCPLALGESAAECLMPPPQEVLSHIARSFSAYTLEDYCEIEDTPDGDYGFALLTAGDERLLLGYMEKNGKMTYWLKNHGAVPQGNEPFRFFVSNKGEEAMSAEGEYYVDDGWTFGVLREPEAQGDSYEKWVRYHWEDSGFALTGYKDAALAEPSVEVKEGSLYFSDEIYAVSEKVLGVIQRDLRYVSFGKLPKTVKQAKETITTAPKVSSRNLRAKEIKFTGGRNYPVYTGPGEHFARSGNGKGAVSTNDWIQVFGSCDGYIMIQYDISASQYRIGWIDEDALPRGAKVDELELDGLYSDFETETSYACSLTDDPINSQKVLAKLPKGTPMTELMYHCLDGWSYVMVRVDGKIMCGFVPSDAPIHG